MSIKCSLCNNSLEDSKIVVTKKDIRHNCYGKNKVIVKCSKCGLIQLIPQWTEEELKKIYEGYYKKEDFKGYIYKPRDYPLYIDKYLIRGDNILEIGCGKGENVYRLKRLGYDVLGIDKDNNVCDEHFIHNLDAKELKKKQYKNKFDVIYGIHLLEHIENPREFFDICYYSLKKYGRLILELPNIDEPLLTIYKNKAFSKFYYRPDHLFFYNKDTLFPMLLSSDFVHGNIILKQQYGLWNHLNWLFRNKPSNINYNIPLLDSIYKFILTKILKKSDTLLVILEKKIDNNSLEHPDRLIDDRGKHYYRVEHNHD
uniref:Putative methyltransferase n=1 Tax=viral metagenome TaxID=1070528 RepID=A0A6M3IIS6_9ZZZZ